MKVSIREIIRSRSFNQLIRYGIVGAIGAFIDFGIFYLLATRYRVHFPFTPFISELLNGNMSVKMLDINTAHIISSCLAITNNFILNCYFTFKVTNKKIRRFASFFGIAMIGLVISTSLMTLFVGIMGLNEMLSKGLAIIIVAMLQFIVNKFVTFREKQAP